MPEQLLGEDMLMPLLNAAHTRHKTQAIGSAGSCCSCWQCGCSCASNTSNATHLLVCPSLQLLLPSQTQQHALPQQTLAYCKKKVSYLRVCQGLQPLLSPQTQQTHHQTQLQHHMFDQCMLQKESLSPARVPKSAAAAAAADSAATPAAAAPSITLNIATFPAALKLTS
jgi:hypothetical protein